MFINTYKYDNKLLYKIQLVAALELDNKYKIKFKPKKHKSKQPKPQKKFFKVPLNELVSEPVYIENNQQLSVPKLLQEMCKLILSQAEIIEGVFRKEGSKSRQNQLKKQLDTGCFPEDSNGIDVAVVIKAFFRELPEALIPHHYQDLFLKCYAVLPNQTEAMKLAYIMLPDADINVLAYLMRFLNQVSLKAATNKMTSYNLAVVFAPNIFPAKFVSQEENNVTLDLIKFMIENPKDVGMVPGYLVNAAAEYKAKERKNFVSKFFNSILSVAKK